MHDVFDRLLVSCPNEAGGLHIVHLGVPYKVDPSQSTGLALDGAGLVLRGIQPAALISSGSENWRITGESSDVDDIHDVLIVGDHRYVIGTTRNVVLKYDRLGNKIQEWRFSEANDSWHINCLALWGGSVVFSGFGDFSETRGYKSKTAQSGFVRDLLTGRIIIDGLSQPHSLVADGQRLILANSEQSEVREYSSDGTLSRVVELNGYTRGITLSDGLLYVGLSLSRNRAVQNLEWATVVALDDADWREIARLELRSKEIYDIKRAPDANSLLQAVATIAEDLGARFSSLISAERQQHETSLGAERAKREELIDELLSGKDQVIRAQSSVLELQDKLAHVHEELAHLNIAVAARDAEITHLSNEAAKPVKFFGINIPRQKKADVDLLSGSVLHRGLERIFGSATRRIQASSLFDADFYRTAYPDLKDAKLDLASHYSIHGWREQRNPSALFNTAQYLADNPDVKAAGINPLVHYLKHGRREGRQLAPAPTPAVAALTNEAGYPMEKAGSSATVATTFGSVSQPHPFQKLSQDELIAQVEDIRASKLFDEMYYVSMYADSELAPEDALLHYCEYGWWQGRNPSDEFDTNFYLATYPDIAKAGINPFWHYAIAGKAEIRHAFPDLVGRYETNIRFGAITSDIQAVAFYTSPDWQALRGGQPAFKGHAYPLQPGRDLGYYDLADWQVLRRQAEIAKQHGITGFCFDLDMMTYGAGALPLEQFLRHDDIQIGFCTQLGLQDIPTANLGKVLAAVMADDRHIMIDGRPVLIAKANAAGPALSHIVAELRQFLADTGVPNPFIIGRLDIDCLSTGEPFDAMLDLPGVSAFGAHAIVSREGTDTVPYSVVASKSVARIKMALPEEQPVYHGITVGHDDTAQSPDRPLVYTRFNIGDYRRWLDAAIDVTRASHPADRRLLFLNAWNNWNTGELLEPDLATGFARLNETARALANLPMALRMPKVSVLVPNYNHEPFLRRRLDSIYRQSYRNIEVILMDDNSTDQSRSVLSEYAAAHPDITQTIFNETNSGSPFRQWAKGIKQASGDLIWIAESDDYCEEHFLNVLVRCFEDQGVLLAYGSSIFVDLQEVPIPQQYDAYVSELECSAKWNGAYVETAHNEVRQALGVKNTIPNASGAVFRRPLSMPLLDDERWQSMRVAGDWVFYLHILQGGKIAYQPDAVNFFRRYTGSTAEATYKKETFYREVGIASQTVAALYDVPWTTLERCRTGYEEYYWKMVGNSSEEFANWYNYNAVVKARDTRMPNILVSTMGFSPGGAEIPPIRLANEFKRQGYSVLLLSSDLNPRQDGVRRMLRSDVPVVETSDPREMEAIIEAFGIEALNTHQWHIQKYPLQRPQVFDRLRSHVASLHGMIEHGDAFAVTADQLAAADEKVTTWVYTADKNLGPFMDFGLYHDGSPKFVKLPNGMQAPVIMPIMRAQIGVPEDAFVLCCVSRAIPDKGWAETIEAVTMARELSSLDIRLILVGNGVVYDEYCRVGVPDFVHLVGFSENSVGYYAAADMGIMLTKFRSESFPLTIVDCLFAGKPYIATNVGEIRNMLSDGEEVAGAVLDLEDWAVPIPTAAEIIARFASDRAAYLAAQDRVSPLAQRYRIDVVASQYVELFAAKRDARRISDKVGTN